MKKRGYSRLERCLLIAVTAALTGLMLPVFGSARKEGRVTICSENLRQLGRACREYREAHGRHPEPVQLVRSVRDRRILRCPEDGGLGRASSYTFRSLLPPDFTPYWEAAELAPETVIAVCRHHLDRPKRAPGEELPAARFPFALVLRAGGSVERVHLAEVREMIVPGDRPTYARVYPREAGYDRARR